MVDLYVTTDVFEAEELIESVGPREEPKYQYTDIDPDEGKALVKDLGFNPMCLVEMGRISNFELGSVVTTLSREGFYVATKIDGNFKSYNLDSDQEGSDLVRLALQKDQRTYTGSEHAHHLLVYSNDPHCIRELA